MLFHSGFTTLSTEESVTTAAQHQRDIEKHTTQEWAMRYTMVKRSARLARIHARRTLTGWGWPGGVEDTVLVVCELVTNAIRHGRVAGHQLALRLALLECGGLVIDVSDPRPDFENFADALAQGADPTHHEQGRGLMVAARLGAEITWFVRQFCGKTVRARLTGTPGCRHCNGSLCKISQGRPQTGARGGTGGTDPTVTRAGRPSSGR
ncbi:ATP-binding protein [Streptomyces phytophilus]|uniref:ATP-binding protein n=1 Tax=Streptomyces phytophilus TaxID=722715 RepID=UPI001C688275|nr:ATP-binding protein [Streptomyces phytophilus]